MNKFLFILFCSFLIGLPIHKSKKECVICHISWGENAQEILSGKNNNFHTIEGNNAYVSNIEMCYSCHDGYVVDSRIYLQNQYHSINNNSHNLINSENLPLNDKNEIYCGTCHTPHNSEMIDVVNYSPFLRKNTNNSQLCISCHNDQIIKHKNHPIHVFQENFPNTLINHNLKDTVECLTCHNMHNELNTKFTKNHISSKLCEQCHTSQSNIKLTDHDFSISNNKNDMCSGCHKSHNGYDKLMWANNIDGKLNENRYCTNCHNENGIGKEKILSNHGHPVNSKIVKECSEPTISKNNVEILCTSCHNPHKWSLNHVELTEENEIGNSLTSFLKLPDDENGQLCVSCHIKESDIKYSDHSVKRDGFNYVKLDSNQNKGQCTICHNTHDENYQLIETNIKISKTTSLCLKCHEKTENITSIGKHTHPIGVSFDEHKLLPGIGTKNVLGCETCHNPHIWGNNISENNGHNLVGDGSSSFLRISNFPNPDLCSSCHPENMNIINTKHDLSTEINKNTCDVCHDTHNAKINRGLLDTISTNYENYGEKHCLTCHSIDGIANNSIPNNIQHPQIVNFKNLSYKNNTIDLGLLSDIDCISCHSSHNENKSYHFQNNSEINDNFHQSFLKDKSKTLNCKNCHGKNSLNNYLNFHNINKIKSN
jgi:predicted CXXCH cytochrome family protein